MSTNDLIYSGSVKDIYESDSDIIFKFTDRYSIFDWGEMPDKIKNKGKNLATMGSLFFEYLNHFNIPNHYLGFDHNTLKVKKIHVPYQNPKSFYSLNSRACLIPLEIIFRFKIYNRATFDERINRDEFQSIDFSIEEFNEPLVEFSTKLEPSDRYIDYQEAQEIAALSDEEFHSLMTLSKNIAYLLQELFSKENLKLIDGKLEFALDENRNVFLVDTIGLDELRIEKNNILLSKEFLRDFYKNSDWFKDLKAYKQSYPQTWKEEMMNREIFPSKLPENILNQTQDLYTAFTNTLSRLVGEKTNDDQYQVQHYFQQYYKGQQ